MVIKQWPAGLMVRRLTSDQEIAGSSPASVTFFLFYLPRMRFILLSWFFLSFDSNFLDLIFKIFIRFVDFQFFFFFFFLNVEYAARYRSVKCIAIHEQYSPNTTDSLSMEISDHTKRICFAPLPSFRFVFATGTRGTWRRMQVQRAQAIGERKYLSQSCNGDSYVHCPMSVYV